MPVAQRLCLFDCDCDDYIIFHIGVVSLSLCLIKYKWILFRPLPQSHLIDSRVCFFCSHSWLWIKCFCLVFLLFRVSICSHSEIIIYPFIVDIREKWRKNKRKKSFSCRNCSLEFNWFSEFLWYVYLVGVIDRFVIIIWMKWFSKKTVVTVISCICLWHSYFVLWHHNIIIGRLFKEDRVYVSMLNSEINDFPNKCSRQMKAYHF